MGGDTANRRGGWEVDVALCRVVSRANSMFVHAHVFSVISRVSYRSLHLLLENSPESFVYAGRPVSTYASQPS